MTYLRTYKLILLGLAAASIICVAALFPVSYAAWTATPELNIGLNTGDWTFDLSNPSKAAQALKDAGYTDGKGNAHGIVTSNGKLIEFPQNSSVTDLGLGPGESVMLFCKGKQTTPSVWGSAGTYSMRIDDGSRDYLEFTENKEIKVKESAPPDGTLVIKLEPMIGEAFYQVVGYYMLSN